jgi:prepilin-type N-terminal cleavage/methylation domain-containing protein
MNRNFTKNKKGFTLLELLISTAIFAITVVIGVDLFFTIVKVQKRTNFIQTIQVDARNNLEDMARLVRTGVIDYDYYADPEGDGTAVGTPIALSDLHDLTTEANKILVIRDQDNNQYFFERIKVGTRGVIKSCVVNLQSSDAANKCYSTRLSNHAGWEVVTPTDIDVEKFLIWVKPLVNPFKLDDTTADYLSDEQPLVTIVLKTSTVIKTPPYAFTSNLQTTVSSRQYLR